MPANADLRGLGKWAENSRRLEADSFSFAPWQTRWELFRNFASLLGPMLVGNAKIGKAKPKKSTEIANFNGARSVDYSYCCCHRYCSNATPIYGARRCGLCALEVPDSGARDLRTDRHDCAQV